MDPTHESRREAGHGPTEGGGSVQVSVTQDASVSGHKSGEDLLYLMRDGKDPAGPQLAFTRAEWDAFVAGVKNGEFDVLP